MRDNRYWKMAATLLVAAFAAVISYNHIYDLGLRYGGDRLTASLLPLVVDGTVAAVSRVMLANYSAGDHPHWLTWVGLATGVGATVAANVSYGLQYGIEGAVIWAAPPVMFVIAAEITMIEFKREANAGVAPASEPSVRAIMREHHVGRPRAKQIKAELQGATS